MTLIELTIAMALSTVVLLGAVAAVRTAQQTMSVCTRLARENDAFRVGLQHGLDEVDFWFNYDAPGTSQDRLTRNYYHAKPGGSWIVDPKTEWAGHDNRGPQGPFKAWDFSAPWAGPSAFPVGHSSKYGSIPALTGDPGLTDFANWTVDQDRTWYRGPFVMMGNDGSWSLGAYETLQRLALEDPARPGSDYRRWLPNAVHAVARHGGVYAAVELLPPGTVYGWYRHDGKEQSMVLPFSHERDGSISRYNHNVPWPELSRLQSQGKVLAIIGVGVGRAAAVAASGEFRRGAPSPNGDFDQIALHLRVDSLVAAVRPADYPEVVATMRRMWVFMRPYNYCEVSVNDTENGSQMKLGFHCFGTTLRGARGQRAWSHGVWQGERLNASW
ncbi:MAG: hypothetical protein PF961_12795 [Planctomycetota bacterium]|nr:hypothetical protein [Planctomycetota bacterium]